MNLSVRSLAATISLVPCFYVFFSLVHILLRRSGKMETPRGRYRKEERTKPVVLKRDRSKLNIILTTPPKTSLFSRHQKSSLPIKFSTTLETHLRSRSIVY